MTKEAKTHQPSAGGTTGPTAVGTRTDTRDDVVETVRRTLEDMLLEMKACQVPTGLKKLKKEKKQHNKTNKGDDDSDIESSSSFIECDEESIKAKEDSIFELGEKLKQQGRADDLAELIRATRPFLDKISKAKAAKLVRELVEMYLSMGTNTGYEVQLCKECIGWAKDEKRSYLRQNLEARLMTLHFDRKEYTDALRMGTQLLRELKKVDDKNLLVEVLLCESKVYHALGNLGKARAALTTARTTANSIYVSPKLQGALDLHAGILHAADERDFKTAYSYFYEAFDSFDTVDETEKSLTALKYMLLSKIMLRLHDDIPLILGGKHALRYAGDEVEAMKAVAKASKNRSLAEFQQALRTYSKQLEDDAIIRSHLNTLYDQMLEQNLLKIVEPYSRVQVEYVAECIQMSLSTVEKKLSQMILDKTISGVLDQGAGVLIVFEESLKDETYDAALSTVQKMDKVVDALFNKAKRLTLSGGKTFYPSRA